MKLPLQCDQIWQIFATLAHYYSNLAISKVCIYLLGKILSEFGQFYFAFEHILIVGNGQILNKQSSRLVTLSAKLFV